MHVDFEEAWSGKTSPSCADIFEWQRIHTSGFDGWDLTDVRPAVQALFRMRPNGMDGEWLNITQEIDWTVGEQTDVKDLAGSLELLRQVEEINEKRIQKGNSTMNVIDLIEWRHSYSRHSLSATAECECQPAHVLHDELESLDPDSAPRCVGCALVREINIRSERDERMWSPHIFAADLR